MLHKEKKNNNKKTLFAKTNKKKILHLYFSTFEGHLSQKDQQTSEQSNFLFFIAKRCYFVTIFIILI